MSSEETVPRGGSPRFEVGTLTVEVVSGPDRGRPPVTGERVSIGSAEDNDLVLRDPMVSRYHAEIACDSSGLLVVDHGSTNGTFAGSVRVERAIVPPGTVLSLGGTSVRAGLGGSEAVELYPGESLAGLRGRSPALRRLMAQIERVASSSAAVLIAGESGTGKERIAEALHLCSPRAGRPFEVVDSSALVPALVASELFGHERGAFTGADQRHAGALERAGDGTVFLDEIGEVPPQVQALLLGALERRRFRRVGGKVDLPLGARVVSATHRELRNEVNAGRFRLDLYYRLAVVTLRAPALRDRPEDIPLLVEHFVREAGHDGPLTDLFSPAALTSLARHAWPGNVRELRNLVEATLALGEVPQVGDAESGSLGSEDAESPGGGESASLAGGGGRDPIGAVLDLPYKRARASVLEELEGRYFERLLDRCGGNVSRAAREAEINRTYLIEVLRKRRKAVGEGD
ncbi:MAG: sigma 54-interacting transcriptional regulator [Polyangiaceae bacterium]